jgi:hypothetical protein
MDENGEGAKLLLSYNMNTEDLKAYYQFVLGQYIPAMQVLGLEMSEAWHTAYGDYPDRLVGFVAKDRKIMDQMLQSDAWKELNDKLLEHVSEFSYKVVRYELGFQI